VDSDDSSESTSTDLLTTIQVELKVADVSTTLATPTTTTELPKR
jgi:hypothetical protein